MKKALTIKLIFFSYFLIFINSHLIAGETGAAPQSQAAASVPSETTNTAENSRQSAKIYKFAYFDMIYQSAATEYQFLSSSLSRSMRSVLSGQGFVTADSQGKQIEDVYERQKILAIGKEISTDLILCGRYYIVGEGINAKIHLIIVVYDVNGGERVIQKLVVGGTGTGMFAMIDESAAIIKDAVVAYFNKRQEMLEEAKKQREEMERLAGAERVKKLQEELNLSLIKTRYNNSMYLDSHVAREKQLKIFYFFAFEKCDLEYVPQTQDNSANLPSNLAISFGIGKELELKLDISVLFYRRYDLKINGIFNKTLNAKMEFYNPTLGIKWRFLQNENHGVNASFYFGFQPALSKNAYGGTIFQLMSLKSINTLYANFSIDKTLGKFTPYFNIENAVGIRYKGVYVVNYIIPDENAPERTILDFGPANKRIFYTLTIKLGTEIQFNSWFLINVGLTYMYQSGYENTFNGTSGYLFDRALALHILTPDIKVIFKVKPDLALSLDFHLNLALNKLMVGDENTLVENKLKASYKIIFYAAWAVDFR